MVLLVFLRTKLKENPAPHRETTTQPLSVLLTVMARKSSQFQSSERLVALKEALKWLEEVLNLPPNF